MTIKQQATSPQRPRGNRAGRGAPKAARRPSAPRRPSRRSTRQAHTAFVWRDEPVSTGFLRRFCAMLDKAYAEGLWFILCGQPGDGKTTAIRAFLRKHPGQKQPGLTQMPVLPTRVPHGYSTANALMLAFAAEFGPAPTRSGVHASSSGWSTPPSTRRCA